MQSLRGRTYESVGNSRVDGCRGVGDRIGCVFVDDQDLDGLLPEVYAVDVDNMDILEPG